MIKITNYYKYLCVVSILLCLFGCEKQNGPFNTDVKIINDLKVNTNANDTILYDELKIYFDFNGIIVLEDGPPYEMWDYYTEMPDGYYFKDIKIYANNKYNEVYDKGDNINNIVEIECWGGISFNLGSINNYDDLLLKNMYLILSQPPKDNDLQSFIIEIDNGAGKLLRDTTQTIYLLKE